MLSVKKLVADAVPPRRAHDDDAGYDLTASQDAVIEKGTCVMIGTGIAIAMPPGVYGRIAPRSSLGSKNIIVNGGIIDQGYRGEIKVILSSLSSDFHVRKGDRIAQLILENYTSVPVAIVDDLPESTRGTGGFGSTGV
jgi:dUTP pyrophosphatase